jgi:proteasome lid subunit RPN8/RPN11
VLVLRLRRDVLEETYGHFRTCGRGRRECVAYWLGPRTEPGTVSEVVHPLHTASATAYNVDGAWLNELWLRLAREELDLRAQVHTHPGSAFHSSRDDDMAALQTPGFTSLVIPAFALGEISLEGAHLERRGAHGEWEPADPASGIEVV